MGSEVDAAKAKVERLGREVAAARSELSKLQERSAALVDRLSVAEGELERIDAALAQTRRGVEDARTAYEEVRKRLDARAHMTYMEGPAGNVGFLLGAASFADLADRLEYIDAVSRSDMDIANEAENLRLALLAEERRQEALRANQAEVVGGARADLNQLRSQFEEQQRMLATVEAEEREAEQAAQVLSRQYQQQVADAFRGPVGNGPIRVCPVGQPRGFGDDFGAPRYAGGYHPHAGNDIFAPTGTPIYAPFDGYAYDASNTLGGLSVIVRGSAGYVYNAHLSRFGELGNVSTGDVIGYVGATGDTSTPHDHFEWHPNVTPQSWPASQYGASVIPSSYGSPAVNPRPLLLDVC
jgi:murein DD-endopeptidase MepM/ murein hydrolase activator NlpD